MAYLGETADGGNYYNVHSAVAAGAPNRRDDVLLVQWLLHRVYADHPNFSAPDPAAPGTPRGDVTIDGIVGPQTVAWITAFQNDVRQLGLSCAVDGRVDSACTADGGVSRMSHTIL